MAKVAWITGVSRGLGRVLAEGLAADGWTIAGGARSDLAVEDLQMELGEKHYLQTLDVADERQVKGFVEVAEAMTGAPDLLINNAAIINEPKVLWEMSEGEIDDILAINIGGVVRMMRHVMPLMIARGSGVVANLSSGWGRSTSPEVAPYCATKWAIEGLSQATSQEVPAGIGVVAVNPGVIDTEMLRLTWQEGAEGFPTAAEWGEAAVPFFASLRPEMNGRALTVG